MFLQAAKIEFSGSQRGSTADRTRQRHRLTGVQWPRTVPGRFSTIQLLGIVVTTLEPWNLFFVRSPSLPRRTYAVPHVKYTCLNHWSRGWREKIRTWNTPGHSDGLRRKRLSCPCYNWTQLRCPISKRISRHYRKRRVRSHGQYGQDMLGQRPLD